MRKSDFVQLIVLKIIVMLFCLGFIFNHTEANADDPLSASSIMAMNLSYIVSENFAVGISTGIQNLIAADIAIEYSFDLDVTKPKSLMPGQEGVVTVSPNNELMKITLYFSRDTNLMEITFPLGSNIRINNIYHEIDGYFVTSANTSVLISGPAVSNVDVLRWNESSSESFAIQAYENAKDGDVIGIKLPTRINVGVQPFFHRMLFDYEIGIVDIGTFDASPTIYETIQIVDPNGKNSESNEPKQTADPNGKNSESNESKQTADLDRPSSESFGGGCLIATAAYGTEMAPQIQMLREVRDTALMRTESGSWFISAFNTIYYAFSPTVADWERQSPLFAGAVRTVITPMMWSLSIMSNADDTERSVLGYGISVLALNAGLYVIIPTLGILAGIKLVVKRRTVRAPVQRDDYHKVK